jgi:hypothetical protein
MRTLFAIIFGLLIVVVMAVSIVIIADWYCMLDDKDVRLSFRAFRKFYNVAPEKYHCYYGYIRYQTGRYSHQNIVMKTPIDYVKYVLWRRKIERRKATAENVKATQKYVDSVRKDIENYNGGDTESNL